MQCERPENLRSTEDDTLTNQNIERMKKTLQESNPTNYTLSTIVGFISQEDDQPEDQKKKGKKGKIDAETLAWRKQ